MPVSVSQNHGVPVSMRNGWKEIMRNITMPGTYSIEIQLGCSVISDEIKVSWHPELVLALPPDTVICPGSSMLLSAGGDGI